MNKSSESKLLRTEYSGLEDVEGWEFYKETHYVRTTEDLLLPLPTIYSARMELRYGEGFTKRYLATTQEEIQWVYTTVETKFPNNPVFFDGTDIKHELDYAGYVYGEAND